MILAYITCKNKAEAKKISSYLLKRRLVACVNMFPISSMYWWNKKIVSDREIVVIAKTIEKNYNKVKSAVKKIHSYAIPCILRIDSLPNKEYLNWVKESIKK